MMRLVLFAAAGFGLAACGHTAQPEPVVRIVELKVPVAVSCVPAGLGEEPEYVDTDAKLRAAAGAEDRFQLLAAGRVQRENWLSAVRPVLKGCR